MGERLPETESWNGAYWVGHPDCDGPTASEQALIGSRNRVELLVFIEDPDANYSYDEAAIVLLDGVYYLCQTSGCSCPSPTATWRVTTYGTADEVADSIRRGDYFGRTYSRMDEGALLAALAPAPAGEREGK